ncbi:NAD(P)/FAD-dependent oxidoreductase [Rhodococcus chondri]|uniref:FAD-dependent oxidoreductase n=1 Tax=Rhodococcus chondri TaxID=3065941 RepID=A0ABU7JPM6_9NOCA|nr:FAD-dependent oxidoreductase [Rhodococcus sp. CC-R104]MEE2031982.1 FAD-dependent oxidoreductase [Rhodococcus sp. CC-R104]
MNISHHEVVVVGAGPIGSATARHLAEQGVDVAVVGPDEPATFEDHQGTWAGYYDEGRLAHVLEVPLMTSILTMRSIRRFEALREKTGVEFTTPTHSVTVLPADMGEGSASLWFDRDLLAANARDLGVEVHELDEEGLRANYPDLSFEPGHVALVQRDAFILNPRALVRAELTAAVAAGATLVRDEIVRTEAIAGGVRLTGRSGEVRTAAQVVLATGAASNATGLLSRPLAMSAFGATVVLAEVEDPESLDMPTMMLLKHRDGKSLFGGIVMAPRPYPDGRWYLKLAGASLLDHPLETSEEISAWVRTGGDPSDIDMAVAVLDDLLPGRRIGPMHARPCLVSATPTDRPYIDRVDEHTVIAVEAERGAMSADEIGRLTAMLSQGPWRDTVPHEVFKAQWVEPACDTEHSTDSLVALR